MSYTYTRIRDLEPMQKTQNFYGKVIFHGKHGDRHVLLVKDETSMIYVWVKPKERQELKFVLRQVVRFHRCAIVVYETAVRATATIGKAGCHVIGWPQFGDPATPTVISSKEWTRSKEDRERIETLSQLDRGGRQTSVDELADRLIDVRETQRAKVIVSNWLRLVRTEDADRLRLNTRDLLLRTPGSIVDSKSHFPVDRSFFDEQNAEDFVQFVLRCSDCFAKHKQVVYVKTAEPVKCRTCKKKMRNVEVAVRMRVDLAGHNLIFTIPVALIDGHETLPDLSDYLRNDENQEGEEEEEEEEEELDRKLRRFRRRAQKMMWDASVTAIRGRIMGRSVELKFADVFLFRADFLDLQH